MMRRILPVVGFAATVVCFSEQAAAIDLDNGTLNCGTTPTYYPRGDYWVTEPPNNTVTYNLQDDGTGNGLAAIPGTTENTTIQAAFDTWMAVKCNGTQVPRARLTRGPDYPTRDTGDNPDAQGNIDLNAIHNVVFFVIDAASWSVDKSILAYTNNLSSESGRTVTADMQINAVNFTWRASINNAPPVGCADEATQGSTCYDLYSTVIHEVGHFLGLNHVSCTDAIMYPYSTPTTQLVALSVHETTGICALYPPGNTTATTRDFGQVCDYAAGTPTCNTGLSCITGNEFTAATGWGVCTSPCTTDNDCPTAYVCSKDAKGDQFCAPGLHNTGSTQLSTSTQTQCTVCQQQSDCTTGTCVSGGATSSGGICAPGCDANNSCATGFTCTQTDSAGSICFPNDPTSCGTGNTGAQLNEICYDASQTTSSTSGSSAPFQTACGTSLICVGFQPSTCAAQQGACVYFCDSQVQLYSGETCPDPNQTCCYGINPDGSCNSVPAATESAGGCFTISKVGESCVMAENGICEAGASCLYGADNAGGALCYQMCTNTGTCDAGSTCVQATNSCGTAIGICCDTGVLGKTNNCQPRGAAVLRQVGVECSQASDCASGICYDLNGKSACSRRCNTATSAGCPGNIDVNGDAKDDGGFYCSVNSSNEGWCWPNNGPAKYLGSTSSSGGGGGGCASTMADGHVLAGLLLGLTLLRRTRRRSANAE